MTVENNLKNIKEQITKEAQNWQRAIPKLIAVSKRQELSKIEAALEAGQRIFGENQVQEASQKWPELKKIYSNIELHLIGHLQSNKIKDALNLFEVISTVDSEKLARKIAAQFNTASITKSFLIQINIGEEEQKYGINPNEAVTFIKYCQHDLKLPIKGIMCLPPQHEAAAPYFAYMHKIAQQANLNYISQGMSGDYLDAIKVGTNEVRIGSAIFGKRLNKIS